MRRFLAKLKNSHWGKVARYVFGRGSRKINRTWFAMHEIKKKIIGRNKIKIGFGPVLEPESTLGVRKYRIDAILNQINRMNTRYYADIFLNYQELQKFNLGIIVKGKGREIDTDWSEFIDNLQMAKRNKTKLVYDVVDSLWFYEQVCDEMKNTKQSQLDDFLALMDGVILSNPVQAHDLVGRYYKYQKLIEHPVINFKYKKNYAKKDHLTVVWQGYCENLIDIEKIEGFLSKIRQETGLKIVFICHTNHPFYQRGDLKYIPWKISDWEKVLANADIGVVVKPLENGHQQRKPSNKILSYMAAGLPVVCTPSEADKAVMKHGKTGFFAYSDEEWLEYLKALILNAGLRRAVGQAARRHAIENYNLREITKKYLALFDTVLPL